MQISRLGEKASTPCKVRQTEGESVAPMNPSADWGRKRRPRANFSRRGGESVDPVQNSPDWGKKLDPMYPSADRVRQRRPSANVRYWGKASTPFNNVTGDRDNNELEGQAASPVQMNGREIQSLETWFVTERVSNMGWNERPNEFDSVLFEHYQMRDPKRIA